MEVVGDCMHLSGPTSQGMIFVPNLLLMSAFQSADFCCSHGFVLTFCPEVPGGNVQLEWSLRHIPTHNKLLAGTGVLKHVCIFIGFKLWWFPKNVLGDHWDSLHIVSVYRSWDFLITLSSCWDDVQNVKILGNSRVLIFGLGFFQTLMMFGSGFLMQSSVWEWCTFRHKFFTRTKRVRGRSSSRFIHAEAPDQGNIFDCVFLFVPGVRTSSGIYPGISPLFSSVLLSWVSLQELLKLQSFIKACSG